MFTKALSPVIPTFASSPDLQARHVRAQLGHGAQGVATGDAHAVLRKLEAGVVAGDGRDIRRVDLRKGGFK